MALEALLSTRAQRAFMLTILFQGIVVLTMVAVTFAFVRQGSCPGAHFNISDDMGNIVVTYAYPLNILAQTLPCYLALFALAEIFELLMAFDALRLRNVIQLIGILAFHSALIVFAALQIHETRTALVQMPGTTDFINGDGPGTLWRKVLPFLIVSPCIIAASLAVMLFWVRQLYFEFGWAIFHVVGANPAFKTMYQYYQILICLLKFDFFCFAGVTMQLLIVVLAASTAEFGLTIAAIPVVLFLLIACGYAVQREIKWLMSICLVIMLAAETYFIYKLVRFYEPASAFQYESTRATLTIFTIVAFLLLLTTFAIGVRCFTDFDKGLSKSKQHDVTAATKKYSHTPLPSPGEGNMSERQSSYLNGGQLEPRISIE
ncbi:hypothetical protein EUX98_g2050 [Antrodiella citrinella]|uniref:TRP C-terminal domain-containing protein n=1 Tax=Antrodiella citrinella TaxID=2447956 RepID=A0A4S4N293_9APHY|nr:hypothetical protein EUX98_g2050 [Antrodiella citrinella]